MARFSELIGALGVAVALAGCATGGRISAAGDVRALLVAIRDDDRRTFDAHVDRPALEAELQSWIVEQAGRSSAPGLLRGLGIVASGPLSRAAGEVLIRPDVFRALADYYGYRPGTPIPGVILIAGSLKALPDGRVCATSRRKDHCLLTFANEDGVWRLVEFDRGFVTLGRPGA
jgi:hypothetical protein